MSLLPVVRPTPQLAPSTLEQHRMRLRAASVRWSVQPTPRLDPPDVFALDARRTGAPDPLFEA